MAMARWQATIVDGAGNIIPGAHIEVRVEVPGQPLAALKSDRAGVVPQSNPFDADGDGFACFHAGGGAYQIRAYLGASGAPTFERVLRYVAIGLNSESNGIGTETKRSATGPGAVTIDPSDADVVYIEKAVGAATTVNLPSAAARTTKITIVDGKGDADINAISIHPASGETMFGVVDGVAVIDGKGGLIVLTPRADGTGWN